MRHTLLAASFLGLTGLALGGAHAQEPQGTLQRIAQSKTIRLGYLKEGVPFSFAEEPGKPAGYSVDLCRRVVAGIQQQLGLPSLDITWVEVTSANRFDRVVDGSIDLECGTSTNTVSRQKSVDFSLMTWVDGGSFLVKAPNPARRLSDLTGKKIAVMEGTTTERALRDVLSKKYINAEVLVVKDHLEGLNAVDRGTADAYASDRTILIGLALAIQGQMAVALADEQFSYEPYGLVLRRNDADFKQAVNQVLAELYRSGRVIEVYDRWFGKLGKPTEMLIAMYLLNGLPQ
ncbi:MAG TPA: amino acid ABC transporter substrate-binding protein [Burkholderiales bacterium]|nr:amino acid ABC transporter substrate-binding protein [Burkholderiales bacterium]